MPVLAEASGGVQCHDYVMTRVDKAGGGGYGYENGVGVQLWIRRC